MFHLHNNVIKFIHFSTKKSFLKFKGYIKLEKYSEFIYTISNKVSENIHNTEKTVLSSQQKYFVGIYATKFFCCANKTF